MTNTASDAKPFSLPSEQEISANELIREQVLRTIGIAAVLPPAPTQ